MYVSDVVRSTLEGRLAQLSDMNSPTQLDTGVLDAPVGCVTVAFMNVVGAQVGRWACS